MRAWMSRFGDAAYVGCRPCGYLTAARTLSAIARASASTCRRIQRQHLAVAHQHPAVDDRRPHVVAARDVDEVRHRIVHRRLPRAAIETTMQVGVLARLRACRCVFSMPSAARPVDRRHLERDRRRDRARIAGDELVQERRLAHRLEHVEVVVAGGAVGAEADVTPALRIASTGAMPLASFMLLSGLCETPTCRARQDGDVAGRQPDGVRGQRSCAVPEAERLEVPRSASAGTSSCDVLTSSLVSAR